MLGLAHRARILLVILSLLAAIAAPGLISGYADLARAQAASAARDFPRAGQYFESAARLLPWDAALLEQAGIAYASAGDWKHAMPLFRRAQLLGTLSADGWDVFGTGYWLQSDNVNALDVWDAGLHRYPQELKFYARFALAYRGLGRSDAERQALETWVATGRATAGEHYRLGQLLMASDLIRAQGELAQASSMDKTFAPAVATLQASLDLAARQSDRAKQLVLLGRGLGLVDDWPLAEQAFDSATQADPQNGQAWAWLGEARQQAGQDGIAELLRAAELDSTDPVIAGLMARFYRRHGEYRHELGWYVKAADLEPDNPEWQVGIADAETLSSNLVLALAAYQKATELAPAKAVYWRLLASFCADNGVQLMDVGLPAAEKAAELAPNDASVLDTLGWSYSQAGLLYKAGQALTKAVKLDPENAVAHLHLAETYLRKGDWPSALAELRIVRELDPDGPVGALAGKLLQQYFP